MNLNRSEGIVIFYRVILGLTLAVFLFNGPVLADDKPKWHVSAYGAIWAETRLPSIPYDIVTGNIEYHKTYFTSLGLARDLTDEFSVPLPFTDTVLHGNTIELEGQIVKHWGKQDHIELSAAFMWRTGDIHVFDKFGFNFGVGQGISYPLKNPKFEKGKSGIRGVKPYKLQNHLIFEIESTYADLPMWHFVSRIHHRSGIYGIISPRKTGSNYFGFGVRRDF